MFSVFKKRSYREKEDGQALVEFALSLPILMLFIAGIIDFGMILFSYSQASNSLRGALRYAEIFGYTSADYLPYLDCDGMTDAASDTYFTAGNTVNITYRDADPPGTEWDCDTVSNDVLESGDMLEIELIAHVDPFFLPTGQLDLTFTGQRTIIKAIKVPATVGTPPAMLSGFAVSEDCAAADGIKNVSFSWGAMPDIFGVRIYDADGRLIATQSDDDATTCDNCANIGRDDDAECYYAVAFNAAGEGTPTAQDCAVCVSTPPAPVNLTGDPNCTAGTMTFEWEWGTTYPLPRKAYIYEADTGTKVATYDSDMTPDPITGKVTCTDCVTYTTFPFWHTYQISAVQGPPGFEVEGPASTVTALSGCEYQTGSLTVSLAHDKKSDCTEYIADFDGSVTIELSDGSYTETVSVGADGTHTFTELEPGNYKITPPTDITQSPQTYELRTIDIPPNGAPCSVDNIPWPPPVIPYIVTLDGGGAVDILFGYDNN